ncbi:MAG: 7-cyano-7-deazaguanine synthase QueC [Armatimonadetes bacterium]|nr:7-cyano-7-deazaguanine synthase QueC [Armatimonadota bacterium]
MKRCVVLLSGGLDSATCLAVAKAEGYEATCLTVSYGQRHRAELDAAKAVSASIGAHRHVFLSVNLNEIGGSALTDASISVPKDEPSHRAGIPVTYVPARNTLFLSLALGLAEAEGIHDLFIGVNSVDYSGYPDCRPEFIAAFETLAQFATKAGVEGHRFHIHTPLIALTKSEIIAMGLELGVDYSLTHSCYDPDRDGRACGHCDSCSLRREGFEALGLHDPALAHLMKR